MLDNDLINPLPLSELDGFSARGECVGLDPAFFFPEDGQRVSPIARRACEACGVREECLTWALAHEEFGFWAGLTSDERDRLRRHRKAT